MRLSSLSTSRTFSSPQRNPTVVGSHRSPRPPHPPPLGATGHWSTSRRVALPVPGTSWRWNTQQAVFRDWLVRSARCPLAAGAASAGVLSSTFVNPSSSAGHLGGFHSSAFMTSAPSTLTHPCLWERVFILPAAHAGAGWRGQMVTRRLTVSQGAGTVSSPRAVRVNPSPAPHPHRRPARLPLCCWFNRPAHARVSASSPPPPRPSSLTSSCAAAVPPRLLTPGPRSSARK